MEVFKGTKGQWKLHKHAFACVIADTDEGPVIANCGSRTSSLRSEQLIIEQTANAKLIAAAPELLGALQNLVKVASDGNMLENEYYEEWEEDLKKAMECAETAIKKATE